MISCITVDDEKNCCDILNERLKKYKDDIEVIDSAYNIKDAEKIIRSKKPDVVFLDVQMPGGSGFDLLNVFPDPSFEIVFVTAYNEYALKAIKISALDYLLKPVDTDELDACMKRIINRIKIQKASESANGYRILQSNENVNTDFLKIVLPIVGGFEVIQIPEVIYCQAESNYTRFFLKERKEYIISRTLKETEEILKDLYFFRIHNSYLINLNHVKGFNKGNSYTITMSNGKVLNLSRDKKNDFLDYFYRH